MAAFRLRVRALAGAVAALAVVVPFSPGSADVPPRTHSVAIRGFQYLPPRLTVRVGDVVAWKNEDVVPHTATAKGKGLDTGSIPAGETRRYTAQRRGTYAYDCAFHPSMKGALIVR